MKLELGERTIRVTIVVIFSTIFTAKHLKDLGTKRIPDSEIGEGIRLEADLAESEVNLLVWIIVDRFILNCKRVGRQLALPHLKRIIK